MLSLADFGYQIITGLSIQLIGMGFAGMCRRFIVYVSRPSNSFWNLVACSSFLSLPSLVLFPFPFLEPEHCIWLLNLATIALNKSFHDTTNIVANGWKVSFGVSETQDERALIPSLTPFPRSRG